MFWFIFFVSNIFYILLYVVYDKYRAYLKIWLAWKLFVECVVETIRHAFKICLKIENIRCAFNITIVWYPMLWKRCLQKEAFMKLADFEWVSQILSKDETKCARRSLKVSDWYNIIFENVKFFTLRSDIFLPFRVLCFNHFDVVIVLFRISRAYKSMLSLVMIMFMWSFKVMKIITILILGK